MNGKDTPIDLYHAEDVGHGGPDGPGGPPPRKNGMTIDGVYFSERDNIDRMMHGEGALWLPSYADWVDMAGMGLINENGQIGVGGIDDWGCKWIATESTGGQTTPDPFDHQMESVTE